MQHLEVGYNDVINMPTGERRYYLGLLVRKRAEEQERMEQMKKRSSGKGTRQTTISGEMLKNKLRNNEIQQ